MCNKTCVNFFSIKSRSIRSFRALTIFMHDVKLKKTKKKCKHCKVLFMRKKFFQCQHMTHMNVIYYRQIKLIIMLIDGISVTNKMENFQLTIQPTCFSSPAAQSCIFAQEIESFLNNVQCTLLCF